MKGGMEAENVNKIVKEAYNVTSFEDILIIE